MDEADRAPRTRRQRRSKTRTTRRFRRLEKRPVDTAPAPIAWVAGGLLGAAAGAVFYAWEALVLRAAGVALPSGEALWAAIAVSAVAGGVGGLWAAAPGTYGPRWASAAAVTGAGWFAAAQIGVMFAAAGIYPAIGVAFGVIVGVVAGQVIGRLPAPAWLHQGAAAGIVLGLAIGVPLHASVLPGASTPGAVAATAVVGVVALCLACGAAGVAESDRAPLLPIAAGGAIAIALHGVLWLRPAPVVPWMVRSRGRAGRSRRAADRGDRRVGAARRSRGRVRRDRTQTPNLDRFARTALVYASAYATSNWSAPSLGSMLTGHLPYGHGVGAHDGRRQTHSPLRADIEPLASALTRERIPTVAVVADPGLRTYALDSGFARWSDDPGRGAQPAVLAPLGLAGIDPTGWPQTAAAEHITDRAIARAAEAPVGPWLLLVQYADAAGPFHPTRADVAATRRTSRPYPADRYDAALRRVDRAIGRLLDRLPDRAWVIVTSDRGVALGEARPTWMEGRRGARYGHTLYNELIRVPLMIRAPGIRPHRIEAPVSVVDIAPTIPPRPLDPAGVHPQRPRRPKPRRRRPRRPLRRPAARAPRHRPEHPARHRAAGGDPRALQAHPGARGEHAGVRSRTRSIRGQPGGHGRQGKRRPQAQAPRPAPGAGRGRLPRPAAFAGPRARPDRVAAAHREGAVTGWVGNIGTEVIWLAIGSGFALIAATAPAAFLVQRRAPPPLLLATGGLLAALLPAALARIATLAWPTDDPAALHLAAVTFAVLHLIAPLTMAPALAITLARRPSLAPAGPPAPATPPDRCCSRSSPSSR